MGYAKKRATAGAATRSVAVAASSASSHEVEGEKGGAVQETKAKSIWQMEIGSGKPKTVMKRTEVLLFTSELADLIEAGMTLGQALKALANQGEERSAQRYVAKDLCERIVGGESFSEACAHHPKTFPPLYANMLRAGEASGAMVEVLKRLVEHYERNDNMYGKIKGAMTYPMIVLCVGVVAIVITLTCIIPKFEKVFAKMGSELPAVTQGLLDMSNFMISYGWVLLILGVAGVTWFMKWKAMPAGRYKVDSWKLKVPLVKGIVAAGAYSSLAYTLMTLLKNGVNVLQALKICEETCGNAVIGEALATARKRVTDGTSISGPLASSGVFPRLMTDMLAIGEQSGDLPSALGNIGKRYQRDMDRNIAAFTSALGPMMIVMITIVIGYVAVAIMTAVMNVSNGIG